MLGASESKSQGIPLMRTAQCRCFFTPHLTGFSWGFPRCPVTHFLCIVLCLLYIVLCRLRNAEAANITDAEREAQRGGETCLSLHSP